MKPTPHETVEHREKLWLLAVSPLAWVLHFLLSYITVAIWCARIVGRDGGLGSVRWIVLAYTVVALGVIALMLWRGLRRHVMGDIMAPHDFDSRESRYRFIGFATFLLSSLSAVATLYVTMAFLFVGNCR